MCDDWDLTAERVPGSEWRMRAEMVSDGDPRILGEDDRGTLWVPRETASGMWVWDRRFRWWKPRHWPFYRRSRRDRRIAFLSDDGPPPAARD